MEAATRFEPNLGGTENLRRNATLARIALKEKEKLLITRSF